MGEFILFKYRKEVLYHRKTFLSSSQYGKMFVLWGMPTERTRYGNIVINDTNDGLPCKYGGEFCFGSFILGGADSMSMLSMVAKCFPRGEAPVTKPWLQQYLP